MSSEQLINQRIAQAVHFFEELPAVTIIHNIQTWEVAYMSSNGLEILGVSMEDLRRMGTGYFEKYFDLEDSKDYVPRIFGLLERNNNDESVSFFQQVRVGTGEWQVWLSSTRIYMHDENARPLLTLTITVPVDPQHNLSAKVDRLLRDNNFFRENSRAFASLSKRESEILRLMAKDQTSGEIADALHLSEDTVKTHRRNIKKKINAQNQYDVIRFAQAFDLL